MIREVCCITILAEEIANNISLCHSELLVNDHLHTVALAMRNTMQTIIEQSVSPRQNWNHMRTFVVVSTTDVEVFIETKIVIVFSDVTVSTPEICE